MIGRTFSHYKLVSELGAGGMGVVYKARDAKLPRYVAVKLLRPEYTQNPASRRRFLREARAVAAVQHPYVAQIHEADEDNGTLFIVMEYVEGCTLRDSLRSDSYSFRDALQHSCEIAEGLAYVHAAGIIHRDLKPGNIMVSTDGHAKILDFGLAEVAEERDVETPSLRHVPVDDISRSTRRGTPAYMSPEQVRGGSVDQRSDVFAFGATCFEALTRQSPFGRRNQTETLGAILHDDVVRASALNPEIPEELDWILQKCLAKEPRGRYQHTRDLVIDLDHLRRKWDSGTLQPPATSHETPRTLPAEPPHRTPPPADGNPRGLPAGTGPAAGRRKPSKRFVVAAAAAAVLAVLVLALVPEIRDRVAYTDSQVQYRRGLNYLREESETVGSLNTAIDMFNQSLRHDPTAARTWAVLGEAYWIRFFLSKEPIFRDKADSAVARAKALDPGSAEVLNAEGRGFLAQGRYEEAREVLQRAVERDRKHAFAWANLGRAHQGLRNYADGLRAIERAIKLEPQSFRHRMSLGMFYSSFQERDAAAAAYRQAIDLKPNSNYAWNNLGGVLLQMGSYDKAIDAFNESIKIVDNATARSNLGTTYFYQQKYEAAEQEYRRAMALEPANLAHCENLIEALMKLSKPDQVQETSRAALEPARLLLERTPHDARAHLRLATLCARAGDAAAAMTEAGESLKLEPENVQILFRIAKVYGILNRPEQALDVLERAVSLGLSKVEIINDPDLETLHGTPRYQRILVLAG